VLAGGKIYTYIAGTYNLITTYIDQTQGTANANPIILDSSGRPPYEIWLPGGLQYKFVVASSADLPVGITWDYVSGINDYSVAPPTISEWVVGSTPTYVSATQFTVAGNLTTTYVARRRIKALVTAGTVYSSVSTSSYATGVTTVTVINDSTTLDSGLSTIYYGLIAGTPSSLPSTLVTSGGIQAQTYTNFTTAGGSGAYTLTPSPVIATYVAGQEFDVVFHTTCSAAATININGIGAIQLVKANSSGTYSNLSAGDVTTSWRSKVVMTDALHALVRTTVPVTTGYALIAGQNAFTKNQSTVSSALTSGASIAVDASLSNNFRLVLGINATLANPTNLTDGMILNFRVKQDTTGSRTLAYGTKYKWVGGTAPTLSTAASAVDFISCYYDGTDDNLVCNINKAFS
ncbi:MAG: hypothetical protein WCP55_20300, partial [Lentisphaerota bacterium]